MTMCPHHSPTITISPLPVVTPLPASLAVVNVPNTWYYDSPSPVVPTTTPSVNPLVAFDSDSGRYKIRYDLSKDLDTIRVSGPYGPITDEQRCSLVVEGAPHKSFRVMFDHSVLTSIIELEGPLMIEDLLRELHSHFRRPPSSREMSDLRKDMYLCRAAVETRVKRCEAAFDPRAEWDRGMKRIDILGRECKFRGIYLDTSSISDYLKLCVVFGK